MQQMVISNINDGDFQSLNLNELFDPNGKHKNSFEFQRSCVTNPFAGEGGKLEIYFYTLPPGKASYPYHYHIVNEEAFYIVSCKATLKTPDGERTVSSGDMIVMPANANGAHMLVNTSDTPLVYIDIQTANSPDIAIRPDDGKFLVIGGSKEIFLKTFKIDSAVNYLADE